MVDMLEEQAAWFASESCADIQIGADIWFYWFKQDEIDNVEIRR